MSEQKTIFTVIFGPYEQLKEPLVDNPDWNFICFTDQPFVSNVWKIVQVPIVDNPRLKAREYKILFYKFIESEFSIYIDGSFEVNCNLTDFWNKHYKLSFNAAIHPWRNDVYEEAETCLKGMRGGCNGLKEQIEAYRNIVPKNNGLISSGILLRKKSQECIDLCNEWFHEVKTHSHRDQIGFSKVCLNYQDIIHRFQYRYCEEYSFMFTPHRSVIIDGTEYF